MSSSIAGSVFGTTYADQYDNLYRDKDYVAECDLLEKVFQYYAQSPIHSILDLGCGTGNHTIALAQRGYHVTGVDISGDMLAHAHRKAAGLAMSASQLPLFQLGDVRSIRLEQIFDAVVMMFAVLGYQSANADLLAALRTVRHHLRPGGMFVCDVWYGPAVLTIRPGERVKVVPITDGKVIRATSGSLDTFHHLSLVHYHLWHISGQNVISETEETHTMRYFFPQELAFFLDQVGLELVTVRAFGNLEQLPNETTWNVSVVARG